MTRRGLLLLVLLVLALVVAGFLRTAFFFLRMFALAAGALGVVAVIALICVLLWRSGQDKK